MNGPALQNSHGSRRMHWCLPGREPSSWRRIRMTRVLMVGGLLAQLALRRVVPVRVIAVNGRALGQSSRLIHLDRQAPEAYSPARKSCGAALSWHRGAADASSGWPDGHKWPGNACVWSNGSVGLSAQQ